MTDQPQRFASVRYLVDDLEAAIEFYTTHLGFTVMAAFAPTLADVVDELSAEVERLEDGGVSTLCSAAATSVGGSRVLLADPAGNLIELFTRGRADRPVEH